MQQAALRLGIKALEKVIQHWSQACMQILCPVDVCICESTEEGILNLNPELKGHCFAGWASATIPGASDMYR